ncbi:MAG: hypothetical protein COA50_16010 [Flavobacteriaceae bacterium]|nr:MAG: hypothetical protein COA50_16010 [Flavobacteriaceae bacterium]
MKKFLLYIILGLCLFSSCNAVEPIFITNDNLKFKSINDSIIKFSIDSHVFNPSTYKYHLKELVFDIDYDNEKIGSGLLIMPTELKSKDTVALPLDCMLKLYELQKIHQKILTQETISFRFRGEAVAVHPLKKIRKDFELSIPYNAKSLIADNLLSSDVILNQIEIKKANPFAIRSVTKTKFRINISIQNKQPFDYKIKKIEFSLTQEHTDKVILKGVLDTIIDVPKSQIIKIPLDVESNNFNILQNIPGFFLGADRKKYIGVGSVTISIKNHDFQIPFMKEFEMSMNSLGYKGLKVNVNDVNSSSYSSHKNKNNFVWSL